MSSKQLNRYVRFDDEAVCHNTVVMAAEFRPVLDQENADLLTEIFGTAILDDQPKVMAILKAQREVSAEAGKILDAAISMGRSMLDVKRALTPDEFTKSLKHSPRLWDGFSASNVRKLIDVAEWWDSHRLPRDNAPKHYTTLYEFCTLREDVFTQAIEENVFRADVTRTEVIGWKRELSTRRPRSEPRDPTMLAQQREMARLRERETQLSSELTRVRARIAQMQDR